MSNIGTSLGIVLQFVLQKVLRNGFAALADFLKF